MSKPEPVETPCILTRNQVRVSPWVRLVAKDVQFTPEGEPQTYHCLGQSDYVAILAQTPSGLIPLVRQYRPAVEAFTLELPAGLLEAGEDPELCCRRELHEETGLDALEVVYLGCCYPDTGRLQNRLHAFYVRASEPIAGVTVESGVEVEFVTLQDLRRRICNHDFKHQLHVAVVYQFELMMWHKAA